MTEEGIEGAKARHEGELMSLPNVVGVGIGERSGEPAIVVLVTHKVPLAELAPDERVPPAIEGFPVVVTAAGEIRAENRRNEES
jgi:hypothetical protein